MRLYRDFFGYVEAYLYICRLNGSSMANIALYKASAGSGKTFVLVYEYVKYLYMGQAEYIRHATDWHRNVHRGVLAVTFTNKATAEMKERIVKGLAGLALGDEGRYVEWLRRDLSDLLSGVDDGVIADVAGRLLADLLNDYTAFRVTTIDGFFQQVMRSFANDFRLDSNYRVELDSGAIIEYAVDDMLSELGDTANRDLLVWLTELVGERVDEGSSWNPRRDILDLAACITSEQYVLMRNRHSGVKVDFDAAKRELKRIKREYEDTLKRYSAQAAGVLQSYGRDINRKEDTKVFKSNSLSRFRYDDLKKNRFELTATFIASVATGGMEGFFTKSNIDKAKKGAFEFSLAEMDVLGSRLSDIGREIVRMCGDDSAEATRYNTVCRILQKFYVSGILQTVERYVDRRCNAMGTMILSSTAELISRIIDGSDTPFIYERIGMFTDHFMIDEFQDTSRLQWTNFMPLIRDAVARNEQSMIVGDVKQSIYRWRNGDWHILHEGVRAAFGQMVVDKTLDTNYRSLPNVVHFNNYIYGALPRRLDEISAERFRADVPIRFAEVYGGVEQKVDARHTAAHGYVRCAFIHAAGENRDDTYSRSLDDMIAEMRLMDSFHGVAVLARYNRELVAIANRLVAEGLPFCSSEALCVADDSAVRLIVAAVRYGVQPYERLYRTDLLSCYRRLMQHRAVDSSDFAISVLDDGLRWLRLLFAGRYDDADRLDAFCAAFDQLKYQPLYREVEGICTLFQLDTVDGGSHAPFVRSFMDTLQKYCTEHPADVVSFLDYWDTRGSKLYIPIPEDSDTIFLCTIHKSKGLGFDTVFLPFVSTEVSISPDKDNYVFFSTPDEIGLHTVLPYVVVNLRGSKALAKSYFRDEVYREFFDRCLDELNVLYVATTRAKNNLYLNVILPERESDSTINMAQLLHEAVTSGGSFTPASDTPEVYCLGERYESHTQSPPPEDAADPTYPMPTLDDIDARAVIRYTRVDDGRAASPAEARRGQLLHGIFARITTLADIPQSVDRAVADGAIDATQGADLLRQLMPLTADQAVARLFDSRYHVINEAEIWDPATQHLFRPDRLMFDHTRRTAVVVDYKFGTRTDAADRRYARQISEYMRLIADMGYTVTGYILYALRHELIEIN